MDWAHAPKLNVRIDFPAAWGTSTPPQGDITPAKDIRKGYEFSVDFTPDGMYTINSWQVFLTSDLETVSGKPGQIGNWLEDQSLIAEKKIVSLDEKDVKPPDVTAENARGGTYKFTIYTTEPVTIVPWCDSQLRITRTEPRDFTRSGKSVSRASDIVLYFNGALNEKTVRFAKNKDDNGIWITAESGAGSITNDTEKWFAAVQYAAVGGFFTVTMNSGAKLPPEDSLITVTVKGIESAQGDPMDEAGYTFSWMTSSKAEVNLISYNALYKDDEKIINVSCEQDGATLVKMFYRQNRAARTEFFEIIDNVPALNDTGVRGGVGVSNMAEYEIFIELYADGIMESRSTFKIWNFPGMSVSDTNPAIEITTQEELAAMKDNLGGQYVLADDITVAGKWTPVGNLTLPAGFNPEDIQNPEVFEALNPADLGLFYGKLYGNGHTITLNGGISDGSLQGLFGSAYKSVIRDFTLEYNSSSPIIARCDFMGSGIIGSVAGFLINTNVSNIIISGGTLAVTAPSGGNDSIIMLGGIAGMIEGSGIIKNCRAALPVKYTSTGHAGKVCMGAIAAMTNSGTGESIKINNGLESDIILPGLLIDGVTVAADVSAVKGSYSGEISIGGAVGGSGKNTLNDITFNAGTVSISRSSFSNDVCGGIAGNVARTSMVNCLFLGTVDVTAATSEGYPDKESGIWIGGLVGKNDDGNAPPKDSGDVFDTIRGDYYFQNCLVRGDVKFKGVSIGQLTVGGVFGSSNKYGGSFSSMNIKDCFFDCGNITIEGTAPLFTVGGFIGGMEGGGLADHNINNCGALQGQISVNVKGAVEVGGFTSQFSGTISNCFSRIDINVESERSGCCNVGGFIGSLLTGSSEINNCYATGTVSVVTKSIDLSSSDEELNYSSAPPYVGGLVGRSDGIIKNSYALGNVLLSDSGTFAPAAAGGLAGYNWDGNISNCFSAGQVSAESNTNPQVYSGGIVGYNKDGAITNTAALGASVIARGSVKAAGRIYGNSTGDLAASAKN